jgi:hypothetical protein
MPTIPGSKLFAVGQVLLQQDPSSFALISPIWEHRVAAELGEASRPEEAAGGLEVGAAEGQPELRKYQWQYDVDIDRPNAERVRALLWRAATGKSGKGGTSSQVAFELAELWDDICRQL